jgi:hypothetical protein
MDGSNAKSDGCKGQPMGLGLLGEANIVFKRKYRWTMKFYTPCKSVIGEHLVKVSSRPNISIEETEINFLHGKMWIPGKATWETISVTFYDIAVKGADTGSNGIYTWLATVYDFTDNTCLNQSSRRGTEDSASKGYAGKVALTMFDGCGTELERWTLGHCWPQAINFGELDYSSSEEATIEVTLRYATAKYEVMCGKMEPPCCSGCH